MPERFKYPATVAAIGCVERSGKCSGEMSAVLFHVERGSHEFVVRHI
jgi:hypothetical protein